MLKSEMFKDLTLKIQSCVHAYSFLIIFLTQIKLYIKGIVGFEQFETFKIIFF